LQSPHINVGEKDSTKEIPSKSSAQKWQPEAVE
jgi:hypothetical protein